MPTCCADGCNNSSAKGYHMVKFPNDPFMKEQWIAIMDIEGWTPTESSVLCEAHFVYEMWQEGKDGKKVLKKNAIPTIFYYEDPSERCPEATGNDTDVIVEDDMDISIIEERKGLGRTSKKKQVSRGNKLPKASSKKTSRISMASQVVPVLPKSPKLKSPKSVGNTIPVTRQPASTLKTYISPAKSNASNKPILLAPILNGTGNQSNALILNSNPVQGVAGNQNLLVLNGGQLLQIGGNQSVLPVNSSKVLHTAGSQSTLALGNGQLLAIPVNSSGLAFNNNQLIQIAGSPGITGIKNIVTSPQVIPAYSPNIIGTRSPDTSPKIVSAYSMASTPKRVVGDKSGKTKSITPKPVSPVKPGVAASSPATLTVRPFNNISTVPAQIGSNFAGFLIKHPDGKATSSTPATPNLMMVEKNSKKISNNNFFVLNSNLNAAQLIPVIQQVIQSPQILNTLQNETKKIQLEIKKPQPSKKPSFIVCLSDDEEEKIIPITTEEDNSSNILSSILKKKSSPSENKSKKSSPMSNTVTMTSASGIKQIYTLDETKKSLGNPTDAQKSDNITHEKEQENISFIQSVKNSEKIFLRRTTLEKSQIDLTTEPVLVDLTSEDDTNEVTVNSSINTEETICSPEVKEVYIDIVQKKNVAKPAKNVHFNGARNNKKTDKQGIKRKPPEVIDVFDNFDSESAFLPESPTDSSKRFNEETSKYYRRLRLLAKVNMSLIPSLRIPGICYYCNKPTRYIIHRKCYNLKAHLLFKSSDCEICGEESITYSDFQKHLDLHLGTKQFYCDKCPKTFVDKQDFENHVKLIHEPHSEDEWLCRKCNTFFMPVDTFQHDCKVPEVAVNKKGGRIDKRGSSASHSRGKSRLRKIKNSRVCPFPVNQSQKCHIQHFQWISNFYDCYVCGLKKMRLPQAIYHLHQHERTKPYHCDECRRSYPVRSILRGHKQKQHTQDVSTNLCDQCGETFISQQKLKWHVDWTHGTPSCCELCGKLFYSRFGLKNHLTYGCDSEDIIDSDSKSVCSVGDRVHNNMTTRCRAPCIICKKLVTNMRKHMKLHLRERCFQCSNCGKKFVYLYSLAKHKKNCLLSVQF